MARKPTPDILAAEGVDVLSAILTANLPPNADGEVDYPIDRIIVGKRLRQVGNIAELAASMRQVGQLQAITILTDGTLVVGGHRLAAAKSLGWTTIRARLRDMDAVDAELAEIDENLYRRELSVLEQAEHLQRRMELLEIRGQRAQAGDNQHTEATTTAAVADSMGLSERSAQQRLQIARSLTQDARDRLRGTELADSTTKLIDLARQPQQYQVAIVEKLLANDALTIEAAYNMVVPRPQYAEVREIEIDIRSAVAAKELTSQQLRESIRGQNRSVLMILQQATTKQYLRPKFDQAVHNVAAQMEAAARTAAQAATAQVEAATRTAAASTIGKSLVDWTEDDWAAYAHATQPAPVAQVTNWMLYALAAAAYSAPELSSGKIRKPFRYNNALWICTGAMSSLAEPHKGRRDCLRIHPVGETIAPGERISAYLETAYQPGTAVQCGNTPYVLGAQWMTVTCGHDISLTGWRADHNYDCSCHFGSLKITDQHEYKDTDGLIVRATVILRCDTCGGEQNWEGEPATGWQLTRNTSIEFPPPAQPQPEPEPAAAQPIDPAAWQVLQPIPPANDRNSRIGAVVTALSRALAALGDYEDITGNYTHSWPLRRQISTMLDTLEANRL